MSATGGTAHRLEPVQTLLGHTDRVWHLAWSPDGSALASCSGDRTVRIWQRSRLGPGWRCAAVLEDTHTKSIRCCAWAPGGRHLATASFDGTTAIWEADQGVWEMLCTLEGHENEVKAAAWSPCGNYLATCGRDKTVWFWERGLGEEYDCMDVKHGHSQDVKSLAWHPRLELLASCSYDDSIKLWVNDDGDWICAQTLEGAAAGGHSSTVWSLAWSPDGSQLASASDDRSLRIWQLAPGGAASEPRCSLAAAISGCHSRCIFSVDWSARGVIATGDASNAIKLFGQPEAAAAGAVAGAGAPEQQPDEAAQSSGGAGSPEQQAAGSGGAGSWQCLCSEPQAHAADVNCVRWHPAISGLLASAGDDGCVKLWQHRWPDEPAAAAEAAERAGEAGELQQGPGS